MKRMLKKVFEGEVNLMVSTGFDFEVVTGLSYLEGWEEQINDNHFAHIAAGILTQMYHNNVVIYFQPVHLALSALGMAAKNSGVTPEISGWSPWLLEFYQKEQKQTAFCTELYYAKLNRTYVDIQ